MGLGHIPIHERTLHPHFCPINCSWRIPITQESVKDPEWQSFQAGLDVLDKGAEGRVLFWKDVRKGTWQALLIV